MKIFFGPWQPTGNKNYYRPILNKFSMFKNGKRIVLEEPILYATCDYEYKFTFDGIPYYGSAWGMMERMDQVLKTYGYGTSPENLVFLTQEQFDKLKVLI